MSFLKRRLYVYKTKNYWTDDIDEVVGVMNYILPYSEYKKLKERQEELIQTTPINLTPFYKKKVDEYFNIILKNKS